VVPPTSIAKEEAPVELVSVPGLLNENQSACPRIVPSSFLPVSAATTA